MAQARRSTRPARPRPKTPARVKKRRRKRTRGHHNAELVGLGLVGAGVFLACVLWFGLSGGPVPHAVTALIGWAAYLAPLVLVPLGALLGTRSAAPPPPPS